MSTRTYQWKPELPVELSSFRSMYEALMSIPSGPKYLGNKSFQIDRLEKHHIALIKESRATLSLYEIHDHLAIKEGLNVRIEALAFHYSKDKGTTYWTKHQYSNPNLIKDFEKKEITQYNNFTAISRSKQQHYKRIWRPFIEWCIQHDYEYYQVARVIRRSPGTVRMWANEWGYREHVRIVTKTIDNTGKQTRMEKDNRDVVKPQQLSLFDRVKEVKSNPKTHTLEVPSSAEPVNREHALSSKSNLMVMIDMKEKEMSYGAKMRLVEGITWRHIAMRLQNPSANILVNDDNKVFMFKMVNCDAYNNTVSLEWVNTVERKENS